jgi:hypothetical protein
MTPQDQPRAGEVELREAVDRVNSYLANGGLSGDDPLYDDLCIMVDALSASTAQARKYELENLANLISRQSDTDTSEWDDCLIMAKAILEAGWSRAHPRGDAGADSLSLRSPAPQEQAQEGERGALALADQLVADGWPAMASGETVSEAALSTISQLRAEMERVTREREIFRNALKRIRDGKPNVFNTSTAHDHYAATSAVAATAMDEVNQPAEARLAAAGGE